MKSAELLFTSLSTSRLKTLIAVSFVCSDLLEFNNALVHNHVFTREQQFCGRNMLITRRGALHDDLRVPATGVEQIFER